MTLATTQLESASRLRAARATPFTRPAPLVVHGPFRRAAEVAGDLLGLIAIALCIPIVVLAVATPIALSVGLLLWLGGLL